MFAFAPTGGLLDARPPVRTAPAMVHDFATMEMGSRAVLILRARPGLPYPDTGQWSNTALELQFGDPESKRVNLFVHKRFRRVWVKDLWIILIEAHERSEADEEDGRIEKGKIDRSLVRKIPLILAEPVLPSSAVPVLAEKGA